MNLGKLVAILTENLVRSVVIESNNELLLILRTQENLAMERRPAFVLRYYAC